MSLLYLVNQSVAIKFTESAKEQYDPTISYAFRLIGVDGMGFFQLAELRLLADGTHENASEPFWINKDYVRELQEFQYVKAKASVRFTGLPAKVEAPKATPVNGAPRDVTPKPAKKTALKPKPALN
jgi:hypothetical protein